MGQNMRTFMLKNPLMFVCLQWQHCKVILNELEPHGVGLHFDSTSCQLSP